MIDTSTDPSGELDEVFAAEVADTREAADREARGEQYGGQPI